MRDLGVVSIEKEDFHALTQIKIPIICIDKSYFATISIIKVLQL